MRLTTTTYQVVAPDGTVAEYDTFEEAAPAQQAIPRSQLRTVSSFRDVPAVYAVHDADGDLIDSFLSASDAARFSAEHPGSNIVLQPE